MSIGVPVLRSMINSARFGLLYILAAFPLLPLKSIPVLIVLWCIINLPFAIPYQIKSKRSVLLLLVFIAPFFLYLLSLFFDPGNKELYFILEKKLSILFFPLFVFLAPIKTDRVKYNRIFNVYTGSVLLVCIWVNIAIILNTVFPSGVSPEVFSFIYREAFEHYSGIHPTYMGIFIFFSLLLNYSMMTTLTFKTHRIELLTRFAGAVILFGAGIILGARTPLMAFLLVSLIYIFLMFHSWKKVAVGFLVFFTALTILMIATPNLRTRMMEFNKLEWRPPLMFDSNTANIRIGIYQCCTTLLKENWFLGTGPGQLQHALNTCYSRYPTNVYDGKNYNTHNEFFNEWLSLGLAGLLLFLAGFFIPAYIAIREKQYLYFLFLVFFYFCCITENLLSRQMGVIFFVFFNSCFAFWPIKKQVGLSFS